MGRSHLRGGCERGTAPSAKTTACSWGWSGAGEPWTTERKGWRGSLGPECIIMCGVEIKRSIIKTTLVSGKKVKGNVAVRARKPNCILALGLFVL